jgi:hypothetical protein
VTPYRERDIRNQIHELLDATGAFDGVYLAGQPEDRGEAAGQTRAVTIEPAETVQADVWDDTSGDLLMTCRVNLTFLARHDDAQIRDETAELLVNIAANVLNGQSLAGATLVGQTRFKSWSWEKPKPPERRIAAVLEYQYLVHDWAGSNTAE